MATNSNYNQYVTPVREDLSSDLLTIAKVVKKLFKELKSNFSNQYEFRNDDLTFHFTDYKNTSKSLSSIVSGITTKSETKCNHDDRNILKVLPENESNSDLNIDTYGFIYHPVWMDKLESVRNKYNFQYDDLHVAEVNEKKFKHSNIASSNCASSTKLLKKHKQLKRTTISLCSSEAKSIKKHLGTVPVDNSTKQKIPTRNTLKSNNKTASKQAAKVVKDNVNQKIKDQHNKITNSTTNKILKTVTEPSNANRINQSKAPLKKLNDTHVVQNQRPLKSKLLLDKTVTGTKLYSEIKYSLLCLRDSRLLQDILKQVHEAKYANRIFTIIGGYQPLRKALKERGWLEKLWLPTREQNTNKSSLECLPVTTLVLGMKRTDCRGKYRKALISKLIGDYQADYCWDKLMECDPYNLYPDTIKHTLINRYPISGTEAFIYKSELSDTLKNNVHWFCIKDKSSILHPRTYNLAQEYETDEFIEDYRITSVISLFNLVLEKSRQEKLVMSPKGTIDISIFNFAFFYSQNFLKEKQHHDIDENIPEFNDFAWDIFLENFYKLTYDSQHFKQSDKVSEKELISIATGILQKFEKFWPSIKAEGYMNLWILKPHKDWQGHGIILQRTLESILKFNSKQKEKLIVQKYIERPFLIHNIKFDIRQWFLFTNQPDFCIWMYRDCYLRFSSRIYNLDKLHESIHLTNYAIQRKYKPSRRNKNIPVDNMWHCDTFKKYLLTVGHPQAWRNIQQKMKEAMVCVMMCSEDRLCHRVNTFELFGADFLLNEDLQPVLLEINSMPAIQKSSVVTKKLCPKMLRDIVKVTVDYASDPTTFTGRFELIYSQKREEEIKLELSVEGINYFRQYKESDKIGKFHELVKKLMKTNSPTILQYWQNHSVDFHNMLEEYSYIVN